MPLLIEDGPNRRFAAINLTEEDLWRLYEVNYKYDMMGNYPFSGLPQRGENILNRLVDEGNALADKFIDRLVPVFDDWLKKHAILDSKQWAESRVRGIEEMGESPESNLNSVLCEYAKYSGEKCDNILRKSGQKIIEMLLKRDPSLFNDIAEDWRQYTMERVKEDKQEQGDDYVGLSEQDVASLSVKDLLVDYMDSVGTDDLLVFMVGKDLRVLYSIYENLVFPMWFAHWKGRGIKKTRKRIESIYRKLLNGKSLPLPEKFVLVNLALNAAHQTGSMLDYLGDDITEGMLEAVSNADVSGWNFDLREMGVVMPEIEKNDRSKVKKWKRSSVNMRESPDLYYDKIDDQQVKDERIQRERQKILDKDVRRTKKDLERLRSSQRVGEIKCAIALLPRLNIGGDRSLRGEYNAWGAFIVDVFDNEEMAEEALRKSNIDSSRMPKVVKVRFNGNRYLPVNPYDMKVEDVRIPILDEPDLRFGQAGDKKQLRPNEGNNFYYADSQVYDNMTKVERDLLVDFVPSVARSVRGLYSWLNNDDRLLMIVTGIGEYRVINGKNSVAVRIRIQVMTLEGFKDFIQDFDMIIPEKPDIKIPILDEPDLRFGRIFQIKNNGGQVIYQADSDSLKECVEKAVREGANLEWANLEGANLKGAYLFEANLEGATLTRATLTRATLTGVDLSGADLWGANLTEVDLSWADLRVANLTGANLEGANLSRVNLLGATLSRANLAEADLSVANLEGANLSRVNLLGANLWGANLEGANIKGANLKGTILEGKTIYEITGESPKRIPILDEPDLRFGQVIRNRYSQLVVRVYNGGSPGDDKWKKDPPYFFSESEGYARDYGPNVTMHDLNLRNPFDSLDEHDLDQLINRVGPLEDKYDGRIYESGQSIIDQSSSDTWEMIESHLGAIKSLGYDSVIVYEGGVKNYIVFDMPIFSRKAQTAPNTQFRNQDRLVDSGGPQPVDEIRNPYGYEGRGSTSDRYFKERGSGNTRDGQPSEQDLTADFETIWLRARTRIYLPKGVIPENGMIELLHNKTTRQYVVKSISDSQGIDTKDIKGLDLPREMVESDQFFEIPAEGQIVPPATDYPYTESTEVKDSPNKELDQSFWGLNRFQREP